MNKAPILPYDRIVRTLQADGWTLVRQTTNHLRLHKRTVDGLLKVTLPRHRPVKRSTVARLWSDVEGYLGLV
ncbi:MAG TPA: type II toxin-antitoxin system HicA family toxin [Terriglobia bacterium]|nr:type II toxin-antitoxin system HicA family toxin [Terriglobia bacterium]